ncbi:MAG: TIGR00730 family Rossman fold protein [Acidobacteriota bacterium]|jgi:uncharacterized protein (TIGR00730 family)
MKEKQEKKAGASPGRTIPPPADPKCRKQPLPWQQPKPHEEDPEASRRLQQILESPSYRQADEDVDFFLALDETRGVRLQIDYLKAELLLERQNIKHTIVVFGSTRIREPEAARRRVKDLGAKVGADPGNEVLREQLSIAERLLAKSRYYDVAREFGRMVGNAGKGPDDGRLMLITGGGPGMMEAANRGACDVDARSIGLNITLPHEQYPNPYITPELCFRFHYFAVRKLHFLLRARALVAFPGGYGTFDELFETLTLIQTRKMPPVPVVLVGRNYWKKVFNVDFMVAEGVIDPEDKELFWFAETAEEIWQGILSWHQTNGTLLMK